MNNLDSLIALAANLPKGYKENAETLLERMGTVVEGIGDEGIAWKPPILRLVQGTTDRSSIPRGTAIGDFVLGEERAERPLKFIPLLVWDGRQYWSPDQTENKMLCNSPDAKLGYIGNYCNQCPHSKWNEEENKSECSRIKQSLCITEDLSEVFLVNFAKTNYATGMDFVNLLKKAGVSPYRRVYELDSKTNSKNKNVENFAVKPSDEKATKAELLEFLAELFKIVQSDRKESLEGFYRVVLERKERAPQIAGPSGGADSTVMLTDDSGNAASGGEAEVSEMAKNYVV